jgi:hypothetical protein
LNGTDRRTWRHLSHPAPLAFEQTSRSNTPHRQHATRQLKRSIHRHCLPSGRLNVGGFNPNGENAQDGVAVAVHGSEVYAVWAEQNGTTNLTQDIYLAR